MVASHPRLALAPACHAVAWALQLNVEVHAENSSGRVILHTEINVLSDAEAEVSCCTSGVSLKEGLCEAGCIQALNVDV